MTETTKIKLHVTGSIRRTYDYVVELTPAEFQEFLDMKNDVHPCTYAAEGQLYDWGEDQDNGDSEHVDWEVRVVEADGRDGREVHRFG